MPNPQAAAAIHASRHAPGGPDALPEYALASVVAENTAAIAAVPTDSRFRMDKTLRGGQLVATNCYPVARPIASTTPGTARTQHVAMVDCTDIRLVYTAWTTSDTGPNDTDLAAAFTIKASIELAGVIYRVTFGGLQTATIDPGGTVVSDPIALEFAAGANIFVRTYQPATSWYATGIVLAQTGGASTAGFTATTDLTAPGSAAVTVATSYVYQPVAILGTPTNRRQPTVAILGDSIASGFAEVWAYTDRDGRPATIMPLGAFVVRGLILGNVPWLNLAHAGDRADVAITAAGHFRRHALLGGATHAICAIGTNDVYGGAALATVQASLIALWRLAARRGLSVWQTTILPRNSSSDGWATLGGQSVLAQEPVRTGLNDWIRAGSPVVSAANLTAVAAGTAGALLAGQSGHPLAGYFDSADYAETARNSGIWVIPGVRTVTDAAITSGSATLTSAAANFNLANDYGKIVRVAGAGAAGATLVVRIINVTSTTSAGVEALAGTTVSGATAVIGVPTADGIHPGGDIHKVVAASIDTSRLTLPI